jgi:predicted nucleotidyltransferase
MESFHFISAPHHSTLSLSNVIARLSAYTDIESLLLMGSTAQQALRPESDYDLLAIMTTLPEPLGLVHTTIDQRLA